MGRVGAWLVRATAAGCHWPSVLFGVDCLNISAFSDTQTTTCCVRCDLAARRTKAINASNWLHYHLAVILLRFTTS